MKKVSEVLVIVAVISGVGYLLFPNSTWIVILIAALLAGIASFLVDQFTKKNT